MLRDKLVPWNFSISHSASSSVFHAVDAMRLRRAGPSIPQNGAYVDAIQTRRRYLDSAPTAKFYHPMFNRSELIVYTNTSAITQSD